LFDISTEVKPTNKTITFTCMNCGNTKENIIIQTTRQGHLTSALFAQILNRALLMTVG